MKKFCYLNFLHYISHKLFYNSFYLLMRHWENYGQTIKEFIDSLPKNGLTKENLTKEKILDALFFQIGKTIKNP